MKRNTILAAVGVITVAALGSYFLITGQADKETESNAIDAQNIKQLVQDYSVGKLSAKSASITSNQLIVDGDTADSMTYDLPKDEFFVSIAPYVDQTHPCEIHSLTGCRGEMTEQEFQVNVTDANGNTVLDQKMKSQANGFIDLWLPRDQTYRVQVIHNGKTVESEISTFDGDQTCITTLQLS
ncbi:CueP family metal-binding protein [Paenibacillus sp. MBLB2552]|uniref:CueP family metal-binding protein n=1 Tax=Paenibacillus mellifer TaxID=2937794 RepID=A0A9X2BV40_9BACL|nr:CueP family metal-binding protein [Paenibacillus mellifer]MCK8489771.1 CueP family metal-binding protein [Paenibacillus mellifer]